MGRARSRRRRGLSGGQGAGKGKGAGTGKGTGSGKGTGGSKGRSNANRKVKKNRLKVKAEKTKQENKQKRVDRRNERLKKQFGLDYNDMKDSFRIKINPTQWLGGFTEKTGIPTGVISRNLPGFIKNMKIDHQLKSPNKVAVHPSDSKWGGGVAKDILLATQAKQAQKAQKKAEEKALDKQYKNDQAIYNNNKKNMSTPTLKIEPDQTDEQWLQDQYMSKFGRSADTKTKGGASYWLDQMAKNPTSHSRDEVARMLGASAEAKSFAKDGVVRPGGVRRDQSVYSQGVAGQEYAKHFQPGGALAGLNSADTLNKIAANTYKPMPFTGDGQLQVMPGVDGGYFQFADQDVVAQPTLPGAPKVPGTDGWWSQFADADAFKKFLNEGKEESPAKSDGMGDFMKFMMLMNVMRPGGGGGWGGGGGSQFGYGGLNPGGVQAAYDPMKSLQGMGTWFKDNFGSGSGTSTANINAT